MLYDLYMVSYYEVSIKIFIKTNNLFKCIITIISIIINIQPFNLTKTFSNIHYIKSNCIMSLFIKNIILKTNYKLRSFNTTSKRRSNKKLVALGAFL